VSVYVCVCACVSVCVTIVFSMQWCSCCGCFKFWFADGNMLRGMFVWSSYAICITTLQHTMKVPIVNLRWNPHITKTGMCGKLIFMLSVMLSISSPYQWHHRGVWYNRSNSGWECSGAVSVDPFSAPGFATKDIQGWNLMYFLGLSLFIFLWLR